MAKSKKTDLFKLESTAKTGSFYIRKKNSKQMTEKLELMKYDPKIRKHVLFKETKLKRGN